MNPSGHHAALLSLEKFHLHLLFSACSASGTTSLFVDKVGDTAIEERQENEPLVDDPEDLTEEVEEERVFGEYWVGSRDVYFETCEGRLEEVGIRVIDPQLREEFELLCSACLEVYQVVVNPPFLCSNQVPVAPTVWRGIILRSDGSLGIYNFSHTSQGYEVRELAIARAESEHWVYQYESTFQSFSYSVYGMVFFSEE